MYRGWVLAAAMVCGSLGGPSAASAAIMIATYTGTVFGTDFSGEFGAAGALNGTFSAQFVYDTDLGIYTLNGNTGQNQQKIGGTTYSASNPILSASISINGGPAFDMSALYQNSVQTADFGGGLQFSRHVAHEYQFAGTSYRSTDLYLDVRGPGVPVSLVTPFTATANGTGFAGNLGIEEYVFATQTFTHRVQASLVANQVVVGFAVPEPTIWALMITGFGLAGSALRRRRRLSPA